MILWGAYVPFAKKEKSSFAKRQKRKKETKTERSFVSDEKKKNHSSTDDSSADDLIKINRILEKCGGSLGDLIFFAFTLERIKREKPNEDVMQFAPAKAIEAFVVKIDVIEGTVELMEQKSPESEVVSSMRILIDILKEYCIGIPRDKTIN